MITRAQIRRQLRKNGGIMNAVPRQGHFSGGIGGGIIQGTPMGNLRNPLSMKSRNLINITLAKCVRSRD